MTKKRIHPSVDHGEPTAKPDLKVPARRRERDPDGPGSPVVTERQPASPSRESNDDAPDASGEPKDVGFGASHGYPEGHGGPTSPGDAPTDPPATPHKDRG